MKIPIWNVCDDIVCIFWEPERRSKSQMWMVADTVDVRDNTIGAMGVEPVFSQ
jgi:hypothetical protein